MSSPPLYGPMGGSFPARQTSASRRRFQGSQAQQGTQPQDQALQQPQPQGAPQQQQPRQPRQRPQGAPQGGDQQQQPQGQPQPSMTFAQMQQQGIARPAPPQPQATPQSALSSSITQALQNPSAYGAPQVQQTFDMLNQRVGQDYDYQRKRLNEEMAGRGLSESTIAGQRYSDLATEQARSTADIATQLATQAAQTYGQDRNAAQQAGLGYGNLGVNQGNLDLQRTLGLGNLGLQQGQLTGNYNGQQTLGARQQSLSEALGMGNLGIQQGQLTGNYGGQSTLGAQQLQQQGSQFDRSQNEQSRQFNLQQQLAQLLGVGGLGLQQGQLDLSRELGRGGLGIQQGQLDLSRQLGLGGLSLDQQKLKLDEMVQTGQLTLAQKDQALRELENKQNFGLQQGQLTGSYNGQQTAQSSQFAQQLQQVLQLATMQDKTQNRGIDTQAALAQNDLMLKVASLLGSFGGYGGGGSSGSSGGGYGGSGGGSGGNGSPYTYRTPSGDVTDLPDVFKNGGQPGPSDILYAWDKIHPGQQPPSPGSQQFDDFARSPAFNDWVKSIRAIPPSNGSNTSTVNFGGKQYTQQEWDAYTKSHPQWWTEASNQDLSWLRTKPQNFYDPSVAQQYSGEPVPDDSPFNQQYRDTHTAQQMDDDTRQYGFNIAKNNASSQLDAWLRGGGLFTDTMPQGMTVGQGTMQGMQTTQDWIAQKLREAGYNPDGSRYVKP